MGQETVLFKSKERKGRQEIADFLHQLADKIAAGNLILRQGQEEVNLEIPDNLILEVEVEDEHKSKKGVRRQLEIEIKWYDNEDKSGLTIAGE